MTQVTEEAPKHYYYLPGQLAVRVPVSPAPVLPLRTGQQGYWVVPLPPAPGALPGQPIEWAPVIAYGWGTYSQQASTPPPPSSPENPEWTALAGEEPIPIDDPILSLPLSLPAAGPLPPVEWQVMGDGSNQGRQYTLLPPPPATAPDPVAGDQEQALTGLGQGVDWFVVQIPAPPGSEDNGPSGGPSAHVSPDDGGEPRPGS